MVRYPHHVHRTGRCGHRSCSDRDSGGKLHGQDVYRKAPPIIAYLAPANGAVGTAVTVTGNTHDVFFHAYPDRVMPFPVAFPVFLTGFFS